MPSREAITALSLILNVLLAISLFLLGFQLNKEESCLQGKEMTFHGGHPESTKTGTCWCGHEDRYCMCTPSLAIDLVIQESGSDRIWLVRRKDTNQLAVMGGFVNVGESVEHAVARELFEEMGIRLEESPRLLGIYSDPRRDNRRHTVSAVFVVKVDDDIIPKAADDVKDVQRIRLNEIEDHEYFADHKSILDDYRRSLKGNGSEGQSPINDVVENI
eukprot:CAMPEP_0202496278 /NCGR_PEP_ID=MMETSP1361-20130828/19340_1 /ASSEMBLY_ACC=CAM_ASM_000849 /TAXON_ID=210615 /ORGANISM="Staurosira complex sp., Strain CCMP2646" /LENGTH=216 /DNA_ID=CAMNT_0049127557 /DNA_START=225 /DNA_END=872 /DNA_ORIENTATION=-